MMILATVATAQEFPPDAQPKVENGRIVRNVLNLKDNKVELVARYESGGKTVQISAEIKAVDVIATCSNPSVVQAALVEFKAKSIALGKAALKARIEE